MSELLQALLLTLSALASAVWIGIARRGYGEPDQPALFSALLASSLAAGTGACAVARLGFGLDTLAGERWLMQATLMLGLPLVGVAALSLGRRWAWSRPTWGRILIGLLVFFELTKQLGWSSEYAFGVGLSSALLVAYSGLVQGPTTLKALAGVAGGGLMLALMPLSGMTIGPNPFTPYAPLCLALACAVIGWLLLNLPGNGREEHDAAA